MRWGLVSLVAFIICLGLILRFGRSSNALAGTFFSGLTNWTKALTLSDWQGNTP